jgi:hypothetical protein
MIPPRQAIFLYVLPAKFLIDAAKFKPHLMVNTLTFANFLHQDENFFITQTAANMLVNAADFKFPSQSTFWNKNKTQWLQMCHMGRCAKTMW